MKIGVSGACGKLGANVLAELAKRLRGGEIVGVSRTPEAVAAPAQGRFGDYDRPDTLASAYAGLDRLLIIPTLGLGSNLRARQSAAAIEAAVAAGVGHIVFLSAVGARIAEEPHVFAGDYAAERRLSQTARKWSVLRANLCVDALVDQARMSPHGMLYGLAESRVAYVARDDLAAAAAGLLAGDGHEGATYACTGPASLSGAERTMAIAKAGGPPMTFTVVPAGAFRRSLEQSGLAIDFVNALIGVQESMAAGDFDLVTDDVERLSGHPPRPLQNALAGAFVRA